MSQNLSPNHLHNARGENREKKKEYKQMQTERWKQGLHLKIRANLKKQA